MRMGEKRRMSASGDTRWAAVVREANIPAQ
jgi:hypothetical protein